MRLLFDVFVNDTNVGRVWMNWGADEDPFLRGPGVRFHLVMDRVNPGENPAVFAVRG